MKLAVVLLIVGIAALSSAAPHKKVTKQDLLGSALRYASGLIAEEQDDDDDLADLIANLQGDSLEDLLVELQDDDDDDAKLASFWKKALGHGLRYASGFFADKEDDNDDDENDENDSDLADLIANLQGDDMDDDANLESFWSKIPWKSVAEHGLKYASDIFANQQDEELTDLLANVQADVESLREVLAKLQDDDDDTKVQSFWKRALRKGLRYASGLFANKEDDDDDANLESFWKKLPWKSIAKHGLKYASDLFANVETDTDPDTDTNTDSANLQDDDDDDESLEDLLVKLQDDDDDDAELESFWKKLPWKSIAKHGLKYASDLFAHEQDDMPGPAKSLAEKLLEKLTKNE